MNQTLNKPTPDIVDLTGIPDDDMHLSDNDMVALFTEAEHQRYHRLAKHARHTSIADRKQASKIKNQRRDSACFSANKYSDVAASSQQKVVVLDACHDSWLGEWNRLFKTFGIEYLRSPAFFHVEPADRDGLLGYAHANDCGEELRRLKIALGRRLVNIRGRSSNRASLKGCGTFFRSLVCVLLMYGIELNSKSTKEIVRTTSRLQPSSLHNTAPVCSTGINYTTPSVKHRSSTSHFP